MLGRDDAYLSGLERAHRAYRDAGETPPAVRCAFWIGHNLLFRGEQARAGGWFVQHEFTQPEVALTRGEKLIRKEGAPAGVKGLQFYPTQDRSAATCLWEADSLADVLGYVDSTLGDSSHNRCYEVDAALAFARQPLGIAETAAV